MRNIRVNFIVVMALCGAAIAASFAPDLLQQFFQYLSKRSDPFPYRDKPYNIVAIGLLGLVVGAFLGSLFSWAWRKATGSWDRMATGDKVTLFVGIFAGIIGSLPFLLVFNSMGTVYTLAAIPLMVGLSALALYALRSMEDILPWHKAMGRQKKTGIKILDTNVIIDGRIYDVARTGFLEGQIYVPKFVLEELQHIADSSDPLRRQRGRRGLDVLRLLQAEFNLEVGSQDRLAGTKGEEVDSRLVRLAGALGADLVTNDVNLNRVAGLQNVRVLNLNDLAMSLKPNILPRESLTLPLVREGNQAGQGVGYLDDGTMVVVENGRRYVGETTTVVVTQVIQTERGKMIFADVADSGEAEPGEVPNHRRRPSVRRSEGS